MHARQINGTAFAVLKWRGIALDRFDGRSWVKTGRRRNSLPSSADGYYAIRPVSNPNNVARYEILLEPLATNALFGPHQVRAVSGSLQTIEYDNEDSVYLRFPLARRMQYEVLSEAPDRTRIRESIADDRIPPEIQSRYLQLPDNIDPRVAQLAST